MKLTNLRLVKTRPGRLDAGEYVPPSWEILFDRGPVSSAVRVRITRPDANRPTGQEVIDAMHDHIRRSEVSEEQLLDIRILD